MRVLFVCGKNRLRSPTAEQVFAEWPGVETQSAGLNHDAEVPVSPEALAWAQCVFVMEKAQRNKINAKFGAHLRGKRVMCLDIPDDYEYMDPALVTLLKQKVPQHLPAH